jgi:hypothetical protein
MLELLQAPELYLLPLLVVLEWTLVVRHSSLLMDDTTTSNQNPVRTFSKASNVTSITGTTAVDIGGMTEFDFTDDTRAINKKHVAFLGRRGKKTKVLKSPIRKIKVLENVTTAPPSELKVLETIEEVAKCHNSTTS